LSKAKENFHTAAYYYCQYYSCIFYKDITLTKIQMHFGTPKYKTST